MWNDSRHDSKMAETRITLHSIVITVVSILLLTRKIGAVEPSALYTRCQFFA
jgi:hypothetical protein